jgi:hypothetical protein
MRYLARRDRVWLFRSEYPRDAVEESIFSVASVGERRSHPE